MEVCNYPVVLTECRILDENARIYSGYIQELCISNNLQYIDNSELFGDVLSAEWTSDGIHFNGTNYQKWYNFLISKISW